MAFWGVEVRPAKPHTHTFDDSQGRLRITQATLGNGSGSKKNTVQCNVGNKKPVLLCSLLPDKVESCSLDLEFEEAEEVVFSVIGPRSVHLTGYFVGTCGHRDGDETDSYGEDIAETGSDVSDSYGSDESYENDFIDDSDIKMYSSSPSPKHNSGVIIEEIVDDEKPAHTSGQKVLTGPESEDEDGFPVTFKRKSKNHRINSDDDVKVNNTPDKAAQDSGTVGEDDVNNQDHVKAVENKEKQSAQSQTEGSNKNGVNPAKKKGCKTGKNTTLEPSIDFSAVKIEATGKNNENDDEKGETLVNVDQVKIAGNNEEHEPDSNGASVADSGAKASKKNKKKNKRTKEDTAIDVNEIHAEVSEDARSNAESGSKKKRKKAKSTGNIGEDENAEIKSEDIQPQQRRTFPNGFIVEELQMGKPDGKRASIGKKVSVHYIGKLKDGKIFDSSIGSRPFQFRLGVGQVIKGWDIGVDGMRVGDKRRLTIPPSLGYGDKKVGKIPPNSCLTFDVELVDVK